MTYLEAKLMQRMRPRPAPATRAQNKRMHERAKYLQLSGGREPPPRKS